MRRVLAGLAITTALIVTAAAPVTRGNSHHVGPIRTDGCSVYPNVPNPCDPDSNN